MFELNIVKYLMIETKASETYILVESFTQYIYLKQSYLKHFDDILGALHYFNIYKQERNKEGLRNSSFFVGGCEFSSNVIV